MVDQHRRMEMEARLDEIAAEIRRLRAEADKAGAETRARMHEEIRRLEKQEDDARAQFRKAREAGGQAFEDLMQGTEKAWKALSDSVEKAWGRFR